MSQRVNQAASKPNFGAFVISLDFEIRWGVRDKYSPDSFYARQNLRNVRVVVPALLELFAEFDISATWATVGLLFCESKADHERFLPRHLPNYHNRKLYPFNEEIGENESDDPLHYGASLIRTIAGTPKQEIATHTYSHYYCLEGGQTIESFRADIESAVRVAEKFAVKLRSIVFPRNQFNPHYLSVLREFGIIAYRGNRNGWMYAAAENDSKAIHKRLFRLADSYISISGDDTWAWGSLTQIPGLCNVPASRFLRPYSARRSSLERLKLRRIIRGIRYAARNQRIYHLWWHPHNFGENLEENLCGLRYILSEVQRQREVYGMQSLTMEDVARLQLQANAHEANSAVSASLARSKTF